MTPLALHRAVEGWIAAGEAEVLLRHLHAQRFTGAALVLADHRRCALVDGALDVTPASTPSADLRSDALVRVAFDALPRRWAGGPPRGDSAEARVLVDLVRRHLPAWAGASVAVEITADPDAPVAVERSAYDYDGTRPIERRFAN